MFHGQASRATFFIYAFLGHFFKNSEKRLNAKCSLQGVARKATGGPNHRGIGGFSRPSLEGYIFHLVFFCSSLILVFFFFSLSPCLFSFFGPFGKNSKKKINQKCSRRGLAVKYPQSALDLKHFGSTFKVYKLSVWFINSKANQSIDFIFINVELFSKFKKNI